MTWRVIIRPNAERDLQEAWFWYESQRTRLGDEFLVEVRAAIQRFEHDPLRHRVYYRNFRRLITARFPYKLFYLVEGEHVIVFRVLHGKQDHRRRLEIS